MIAPEKKSISGSRIDFGILKRRSAERLTGKSRSLRYSPTVFITNKIREDKSKVEAGSVDQIASLIKLIRKKVYKIPITQKGKVLRKIFFPFSGKEKLSGRRKRKNKKPA